MGMKIKIIQFYIFHLSNMDVSTHQYDTWPPNLGFQLELWQALFFDLAYKKQ